MPKKRNDAVVRAAKAQCRNAHLVFRSIIGRGYSITTYDRETSKPDQ